MTAEKDWRFHGFMVFAWGQFFLLTATATYFSLAPSPGEIFVSVWDKALHFICWFVLMGSLQIPWIFRQKFWLGGLALFAYSILIEGLQYLSPPREFSGFDMVANGVGIFGAYLFLRIINPLLQQIVIKRLVRFLNR